MIRTIVVPLDESERSALALPYATLMAERLAVPLDLVRVLPDNVPVAEAVESQMALKQLSTTLKATVRVNVRRGNPVQEIMAEALEQSEPVIVMATHGRSSVGRLVHGSVADQLVRQARVPVLLIGSQLASPTYDPVCSILVPLDGSRMAASALRYATVLAQAFHAQLKLVGVAETPDTSEWLDQALILEQQYQQRYREVREYLQTVAEQLRAQGLQVQFQALKGFPARDLLQAYEQEAGVDLVVMTTHGRSGMHRLLVGSVAEHLLRHGTIPMLLIRPAEECHHLQV
jgi:nucleotide-binding universal stress UspA family protein